ncbi:MAG TPA: methylated-DNA--[protein]-cysteine S-methyltransferase [Pseudonocardiaceae bacterium]|nr:methylated-DNA--[protein]-cysteine S-methyltransferase [Pseudonocardiaceae bacterium]
MHTAWLDSPVGPVTVVADGDVLHRVRFGREDGEPSPPGGLAARAATELVEYFAGERTEFDLIPDWGRLDETAAHVLRTLVRIAPFGHTVSYGELTTAAGLAISESRAVGTYLNGNPWPLVVPCHRVVMTDGSLGGFGSGRWRKEELLRLEGVLPATLFG